MKTARNAPRWRDVAMGRDEGRNVARIFGLPLPPPFVRR